MISVWHHWASFLIESQVCLKNSSFLIDSVWWPCGCKLTPYLINRVSKLTHPILLKTNKKGRTKSARPSRVFWSGILDLNVSYPKHIFQVQIDRWQHVQLQIVLNQIICQWIRVSKLQQAVQKKQKSLLKKPPPENKLRAFELSVSIS